MDINELFNNYSQVFEQQNEVREKIREEVRNLERVLREMQLHLQKIHMRNANLQEVFEAIKSKYGDVKEAFKHISDLVPQDGYYRYNDMWRNTVNQLCFIVCLVHWFETKEMLKLEQINNLFQVNELKNFQIDLEDYLFGLCNLASELSRVCVNSVTRNDFQTPIAISEFVSDLYGGFRLLNLKNDNLRKRFDGIKYDLKKIEEVVYDISIRGLQKPKNETSDAKMQE